METPVDRVDSFLTPGAVGNAEWTGVPLCALLERAGLEEDACEIVLEGPDRGVSKEGAIPPGPIYYERSLPRAKEFVDPVQQYAWRRWKFDWVTPKKPGQYTLLSRASTNGNVQPDKHDENYATDVIDHVLPIEVTVGDPLS